MPLFDEYGKAYMDEATLERVNARVGAPGALRTPVDKYGYTTDPKTGKTYLGYDPYREAPGSAHARPDYSRPETFRRFGPEAANRVYSVVRQTPATVNVHGDLIDPMTGEVLEMKDYRASAQPGEKPPTPVPEETIMTQQPTVGEPRSTGAGAYQLQGEYRKEGRSPTLRERRRAMVGRGGTEAMRRYRMARNLAGYRRDQAQPVTPSYGRYDPYSATWWEWGKGIGGTDKGGNVWSVEDLGIQY